MSRRIKNIIVFLFLLFIAHFILLFIYQKVEQKSEIAKTFENFEANPSKYKFLFMGSSHAKRAVDTSIVKNSISFAYYGQNIVNTYYFLKHILEKHNDKFEVICLPNDFGYYSLIASEKLNNMFFYNRYFDFSEYGEISDSKYKSWKKGIILKYFPYTELRSMLKSKTRKKKKEKIDFSKYNKLKKNEIVNKYLHQDLAIKDTKDIFDEVGLKYLQMTLDLLKNYNKKAYFICYPYSKTLQKQVDDMGNYHNLTTPMILEEDHQMLELEGVFFENDNYFFDAHHLNYKGGKAASKKINYLLNGD